MRDNYSSKIVDNNIILTREVVHGDSSESVGLAESVDGLDRYKSELASCQFAASSLKESSGESRGGSHWRAVGRYEEFPCLFVCLF